MRDALLAAFHRRHACHRFDPGQALTDVDLDFILEAGRLSPSSFGLEQWHFVVSADMAIKSALSAASFGQSQIEQASAVIVILAKLAELEPDTPYARRLLEREYPGERFADGLAMYRNFYAATDVPAWSIAQCHIAAANMMTAAAAINIGSCPIGGFDPHAVESLLELDPAQYRVALILALGQCADPVPIKQRLPLSELVTRR